MHNNQKFKILKLVNFIKDFKVLVIFKFNKKIIIKINNS